MGVFWFAHWSGIRLRPVVEQAFSLIGVALIAGGVLVLGSALWQMLKTRRIVIDGSTVSGRPTWPPFAKPWSVPLNSYQGVAWRQLRTEGSRQSAITRYTHVVALEHTDKRFSFPVLVRRWDNSAPDISISEVFSAFSTERSDKDRKAIEEKFEGTSDAQREGAFRTEWEALAKRLNLPAIDARHGREVVYEASDLGKSLQDRLGQSGRDWSQTPPPWPLKLIRQGEGDAAKLTVLIPENFFAQVIMLVLFLPAFIILQSFLTDLPTLLTAIIQLATAALVLLLVFRRKKAKLVMTRQTLTYREGQGSSIVSEIPLGDIQSVDAARVRGELVLGTTKGVRRIFRGQPGYVLRWLRDYIEAAVATA